MIVKTVTVEVHEKKNHPYEYGHYDASVRLEADLDPNENADDLIDRLQRQAAFKVQAQCALWIIEIEKDRRKTKIANDLDYALSMAQGARHRKEMEQWLIQARGHLSEGGDLFHPAEITELSARIEALPAAWEAIPDNQRIPF